MSRTAVLLAVKMNVVLPFSLYDYDQAVDWIEWVAEFCGIQERHVLWLLPFKGMNSSRTTEAAKKAFKFVHEIQDAEGITSDWKSDDQFRDARGPNSMFRQAAWHFYLQKKGAWLFCEPDCIPTKPDAFDLIEKEYQSCGKDFMGAYVNINGRERMNGSGVYPDNAVQLAPSLVKALEYPNGSEVAFDMAGAMEVMNQVHFSKLFQHVYWARENQAPTFPGDRHLLEPETAFFHRNKDGTLIDMLRGELMAGGHGAQGEPVTSVVCGTNEHETSVQSSPLTPYGEQLAEYEKKAQQKWQPRKRRIKRRRSATKEQRLEALRKYEASKA